MQSSSCEYECLSIFEFVMHIIYNEDHVLHHFAVRLHVSKLASCGCAEEVSHTHASCLLVRPGKNGPTRPAKLNPNLTRIFRYGLSVFGFGSYSDQPK